ncbi:helix-turn-helix transcriptional regulator [Streptomyces sp. LNU-CPARS28]|uniref:helix-turn-helix transcriptional regulator n=1 Tax=Streptomyces sp. LNU-CPARS28 TaxID=3137371 RepID=UPI0031359521
MHHHGTQSDVVAEQMRKHRARLGLTREQLAEECARLGAPDLTYSALTNIETGRRNKEGKRRREISVDELLVLGLALAVPPLLLVLPLGSEETVPTVPAAEPRAPYTVWKWFTGEETPTLAGPVDGRHYADPRPIGGDGPKWATAWGTAAYPASLYPEFDRRRLAVAKAHRLLENAKTDHKADPERVPEYQREYVERLDDLAHVINDMTRAGLAVPAVQQGWVDDMTAHDMVDAPEAFTTNQEGDE